MPDFFCKTDLVNRVFRHCTPQTVIWLAGVSTYPLAMRMLSIPSLQSTVIFGLISSLGSQTESTLRESSAALRKYGRDVLAKDPAAVKSFTIALLETIKETMKEER